MMIVRLDKLSNQHCHCITLHCFFPVLFSNIKLKSLHILLNNPLNIILWNYDAKQFYSPRGRGGCSPLLGETVRQWDSETCKKSNYSSQICKSERRRESLWFWRVERAQAWWRPVIIKTQSVSPACSTQHWPGGACVSLEVSGWQPLNTS